MAVKRIFLSFLFLVSISVYGQNVFLKHYSVEDGLLSSEIYAQVQDSLGYLWFATSRGVARFDGIEFKNFTVKDGLPTNSIITAFLDENNRVWFAGYDASLSYYENDKIVPYKFNAEVKKLAKSFYINDLCYCDGFLYLAPNFGGWYRIDSLGNVEDLTEKLPQGFKFYLVKVKNNWLFVRNKKKVHKNEFKVLVSDTLYAINIPKGGVRRFWTFGKNGELFFSVGKNLFYVDQASKRFVKSYPNEISGILLDKDGNLWVSVLFTGLYFYKNADFRDSMIILPNKSPIRVLQDNEGSYWLSTTESGIYYLPGFKFFRYSQFQDMNITAIDANETEIYFATFSQQIFHCKINKQKINEINEIKLEERFSVQDIRIVKDKVWFLGNYLGLLKDNKFEFLLPVWRAYELAIVSADTILVTSGYGFTQYCYNKSCYLFQSELVPTSNSIYYDSEDSVVWLGSINGLFSVKNGQIYTWSEKHPILKSRINDIEKFYNYILLATSGSGFIVLNKQDSSVRLINTANGLTTNFITKILITDSLIWLGTNRGIVKIAITDVDSFLYRIENYSSIDGLYYQEVRDLAYGDSTIFLATSKGLVSFNPYKLKKQRLYPKILIDSIVVDNKTVHFAPKITLKPKDKSLTIYFKAISYKASDQIIYKYRLLGYDEHWNYTKNRYIRFPKLPGGKYKLEIAAIYDINVDNPNILTIEFIKKKQFVETPWFIILIVVVIVSIVSLIAHFRVKTEQKELEYQRQLMIAEQKALRSQMNPHFIFNALNSIRRFIYDNDIFKADYYLTSFATLMRKVLDNSKQNFITLEREIETLKLYLELEKMRFDDSFNFEIKVDPQLELDNWMLPPMIIQPFVENAIWHGLAMKQKDGRLIIEFTKKNGRLLCVVEDNGIGRKKAQEIAAKRKGHKSVGLQNIKDRLQLIHKIYGRKIEMKIIDLYDEKGNAAGTRVELILPDFSDISQN